MDDYKFLFKVVLVGNAGVGKTCLVRRFTQGLFPPGQGATIGVDFMIKTVDVGNEKVKVSVYLKLVPLRFKNISIGLATNMGHCWSGEIQINNPELLQISSCTNFSLWHILPTHLWLLAWLVKRNWRVC